MNNLKINLICRAETLIENNHGVLYKSCISILKTGLQMAKESNDFSDLQEFVPIFEKKYKRLRLQIKKVNIEREQKTIRDIICSSHTPEKCYIIDWENAKTRVWN